MEIERKEENKSNKAVGLVGGGRVWESSGGNTMFLELSRHCVALSRPWLHVKKQRNKRPLSYLQYLKTLVDQLREDFRQKQSSTASSSSQITSEVIRLNGKLHVVLMGQKKDCKKKSQTKEEEEEEEERREKRTRGGGGGGGGLLVTVNRSKGGGTTDPPHPDPLPPPPPSLVFSSLLFSSLGPHHNTGDDLPGHKRQLRCGGPLL
ncbi:hypothetical protein M0804_008597 [Polistes exclamans]|nr:hypothetical protein M0804_008597 [Polistes exclamans]